MTYRIIFCLYFSVLLATRSSQKIKLNNSLDSISIHIKNFEKIFNVKVDVPVYFVKEFSKKNILGRCYYEPFSKIEIKRKSWEKMNHYEQEILMWHELGHCILDLEHTNKQFPSGMPISLMYPVVLNPYYYKTHRKYYIKELKERYKKKLNGTLTDEEP